MRGRSTPVGLYPTGIAFDGAEVWVASTNGPGVYELRASDGERVGAHPIGSSPDAVAFGGVNLWVGELWGGVYEVSADGGAVPGHYDVSEVGQVTTVAFDGAHVWVAGFSGIVKLDPANGAASPRTPSRTPRSNHGGPDARITDSVAGCSAARASSSWWSPGAAWVLSGAARCRRA